MAGGRISLPINGHSSTIEHRLMNLAGRSSVDRQRPASLRSFYRDQVPRVGGLDPASQLLAPPRAWNICTFSLLYRDAPIMSIAETAAVRWIWAYHQASDSASS